MSRGDSGLGSCSETCTLCDSLPSSCSCGASCPGEITGGTYLPREHSAVPRAAAEFPGRAPV
eukprot:3940844-Rhodomonas_salina.11